jgi:hypothetical protein
LTVNDPAQIGTAPESGLDIFVLVAHLELPAAELAALTRRMVGELKWPAVSTRIHLVVSDDSPFDVGDGEPITVIRSSLAASAFRERCLVLEASPHDVLIAFGLYLPTTNTIAQLRVAARNEELISAVAPRVTIGSNGELMALGPGSASRASGRIDPRYVSRLSPAYYLPEILCPCMLVPARMVGNVDVPDGFDHFPDLILALLRAGRRRGLLVRVDNRLTVSADAEFETESLQQETEKLVQLFDDYEMVERRLAAQPAYADERRFQLLRPSRAAADSLLLDCTNIPPSFSGSAEHTLGVLKGAMQIDRSAWDLTVMVTDETCRFFSLAERFPGIRFVSKADDSYYDCAIRLSQPWWISNLDDLNGRARSIAVTIHDTIGPDVIYAVPEEAEEAFQFAAEHADGLIYVSEFSRDQFRRRFARRPGLIEGVIYSSLDPAEYVTDRSASGGEWILIFGNPYDHKDLERTTKIVSAAFPSEKIKVVGKHQLGGLNVEAFGSGALEQELVDRLFRQAKCVVFPSLYEGFGLPLVQGLAYGKAVVARRSRLSRDVVRRFPKIGSLVEFENSLDLVPAIGKVLHGKDEHQASGVTDASVGTASHGWKGCAEQFFAFADDMRKSENVEVWRARERALRYVKSARQ